VQLQLASRSRCVPSAPSVTICKLKPETRAALAYMMTAPVDVPPASSDGCEGWNAKQVQHVPMPRSMQTSGWLGFMTLRDVFQVST
jgi:hypothetical protein